MDACTLRLLDANFNRAREALRVLEDYARFILNDERLSRQAKEMRHTLATALASWDSGAMLAARDTPGDVGTRISTASEAQRADSAAVTTAAAKRLTEALRCLEEYGKLASPATAALLEALRYQSYHLEKTLAGRARRAGRFDRVRLYVLVTSSLCRRPLLEVCRAAVAGGADCIQLREKDLSDKELLARARQIQEICRSGGALFLMNDRVDLAVLAGADGLHLGQDDIGVAEARRLLPPHMLVGRSTHSRAEAEAALAEGPDYLAFGSVFGSPTKPAVARTGPAALGEMADLAGNLPLIAIGGIAADNAAMCRAAGATGVAVCQAVIGRDDPEAAAREIRTAWDMPGEENSAEPPVSPPRHSR